MEGEIKNFIMVQSVIVISAWYCYGVTKFVPKGTIRFFMFLPVLCLFFQLPLYLNTICLSNPIAFSITWLTTFKLLLLVFGSGPLSKPSLSFIHFLLVFAFPVNLQQDTNPRFHPIKEKRHPNKTWNEENDQKDKHHKPNSNTSKIGPKSLSHYAKKGLFFTFLIVLCNYYKDKLPRHIFLFLICVYVYIGLELLLGLATIIAQTVLGFKLDPPFGDPYLATSLQDFWGRRWNRVASSSLRSTIFYPILNCTYPILGRNWATFLALMAAFIVSDLMHEILFYYLGRVRFGWGTPLFFLFHGLCVAIEGIIKRRIFVKWRFPQIITGPLIFGFVIFTFIWLVLPELLEHDVDDRVLSEYVAFATFLKDLGLFWGKMGYNLLVLNLQPR